MAKRYDKQILSDQLADLGKKLGRIPTPDDLERGMAVKSTYLRRFGDWDTALDYAGFTADDRAKANAPAVELDVAATLAKAQKAQTAAPPEQQSSATPPAAPPSADPPQSPETPPPARVPRQYRGPVSPAPGQTSPQSRSAESQKPGTLINLYSPNVHLVGDDGRAIRLAAPYHGHAVVVFYPGRRRAFAEGALRKYLSGAGIMLSNRPQRLEILRPDGKAIPLPSYQPGVYYLVSREVAEAARTISRETYDLVYPASVKKDGGTVVIEQLEIINTSKTWWVNP